MGPQQSWSHHKVLAEEFCLHDEQVRFAEAALREAQMRRSRSLAAFAVTVGRDRSVADLLGLQEREVRSVRREVGKNSARAAADDLLHASRASDDGPRTEWTTDLDAALSHGWSQGVDLQVLAAQVGTDVASIVDRLKDLSTLGMLREDSGTPARGRHRKRGNAADSPPAEAAAHSQPRERPAEPRPTSQQMAESWAAWESQLIPEPNSAAAQGSRGVVLEGVVYPPSPYDH
ncbi:hypothetical protein [Streptomyces sp. SH5]|uniref:hypothetical protein n=1 Tax=Streptomyces sp. SH5 TaxID=3041765 RepID=UPI0024781285|nr:hypothetical protein [Streptomyces sp. SH5]WGP12822.1 hypothetical protein QFA72_25670 [Streptomyces sp. SH5]